MPDDRMWYQIIRLFLDHGIFFGNLASGGTGNFHLGAKAQGVCRDGNPQWGPGAKRR